MAAGREGRRLAGHDDHVGCRRADEVGHGVGGVGVAHALVAHFALRKRVELQLRRHGRRPRCGGWRARRASGPLQDRKVAVVLRAGRNRARRASLLHRQHRNRHIREAPPGRQVDTVDEVTRVPARGAGRQRQRVGLSRCRIRADGQREPAAGRALPLPGIHAAGLRGDPVVGQGRGSLAGGKATAGRVDAERGVAGIREAARPDDPGARSRHDRLEPDCLGRINRHRVRHRRVVRLHVELRRPRAGHPGRGSRLAAARGSGAGWLGRRTRGQRQRQGNRDPEHTSDQAGPALPPAATLP